MAKPPKKPKLDDIETSAEERFERTVRRMLNTPPQPHKPAKQKPSVKRRIDKMRAS